MHSHFLEAFQKSHLQCFWQQPVPASSPECCKNAHRQAVVKWNLKQWQLEVMIAGKCPPIWVQVTGTESLRLESGLLTCQCLAWFTAAAALRRLHCLWPRPMAAVRPDRHRGWFGLGKQVRAGPAGAHAGWKIAGKLIFPKCPRRHIQSGLLVSKANLLIWIRYSGLSKQIVSCI